MLALYSACSPETPIVLTKLNIVCPKDVSVKVASVPVFSASIELPGPEVSSTCDKGMPSFTTDSPPELAAGPNIITYNATDSCGNKESCTFKVELIADYRAAFVGNYKGYRDCWAHNMTQTIPDQAMTVNVDYGIKADYLKVGSDEVLVDSNGYFPHPYFGSYRLYALSIKGDSISIFQQWGALNSNQNCQFRGKKE